MPSSAAVSCLHVARLAALMVLSILQTNQPAAQSITASQDDTELRPVLVKLTLNHQQPPGTLLVLRNRKDEWLLPADTLTASRIKFTQQATLSFEGQLFVPLSEISSTHNIVFDEAAQTLDIMLPASSYRLSKVDSRYSIKQTDPANIAAEGLRPSLFLNYDLSLEHADSGNGQVIFAETGASFRKGVALADFALIRQPQQSLTLRLGTTVHIDWPEQIATLRLGDTITRPATPLGRSVRFGGVQYATNFMTQPQLVTVPMVNMEGQAVLPSTVDVFVNNVLQSQSAIPPGPFSISSVPMVSGDGELMMLVRDLSGREEIISQRFYASPILLAAGLREFSIEAGALRRNFGIESNDYGDSFAAASYRYGVSNGLTLEGSAQWQHNGPRGINTSASMLIPSFGIATAAIGSSSSDAGNGKQIAAGFERKTAHYTFGLRSQIADSQFRTMGVDSDRSLRRQESINASYRIRQAGNLNLAYAKQQLGTAMPVEVFSASFSTLRKKWGNLIFTASIGKSAGRSTGIGAGEGATENRSFAVFWILPLQREMTASLLHINANAAPDQTLLQVQSNLPAGEGTAFRLQAGINAPQQAALLAQNTYGQARLEAAEYQGRSSARLNLSGALANFNSHWFASRRITDSFGLVRLPNMNNVRVYVDNQLAGRTNKAGEVFIPRLHPYMPNHVSLDQLDLALDTEIESLVMRPKPAWRSGVLIEFPVRRVASATLKLMMEDGLSVPIGAVATFNSQPETFSVGRDGLLYLTGLKPHNDVHVEWSGSQCEARVSYLPEPGSIPYLGEVKCTKGR